MKNDINLVVDGVKSTLVVLGGLFFLAPGMVNPIFDVGVAGVTIKILAGITIFAVGLLSIYEVIKKY